MLTTVMIAAESTACIVVHRCSCVAIWALDGLLYGCITRVKVYTLPLFSKPNAACVMV